MREGREICRHGVLWRFPWLISIFETRGGPQLVDVSEGRCTMCHRSRSSGIAKFPAFDLQCLSLMMRGVALAQQQDPL